MSSPLLEPAVVGPLVMVAVGGLAVLICEVLLSRAHTFMSRAVTPSYVGVLLATLTTAFLVVAGVVAFQQASWPDPVAFNPGNTLEDNVSRQATPDSLHVLGVCRIARDCAKVADQVRFLARTLDQLAISSRPARFACY